jgi:hypothetical protein
LSLKAGNCILLAYNKFAAESKNLSSSIGLARHDL